MVMLALLARVTIGNAWPHSLLFLVVWSSGVRRWCLEVAALALPPLMCPDSLPVSCCCRQRCRKGLVEGSCGASHPHCLGKQCARLRISYLLLNCLEIQIWKTAFNDVSMQRKKWASSKQVVFFAFAFVFSPK